MTGNPSDASARRGLLIAAPSSGSGKTVLALALLRALKERGMAVCGAKAGPDFIDPGFHRLACASASVNLDPWAMDAGRLRQLAARQFGGSNDHLLVEAMMGLFDGAADGSGSAADLAATLGLPIVLVVDAAKQSHSVAALVHGFATHREGIRLAGIILNKVGSLRHTAMLKQALAPLGIPVLGAVMRNNALMLPERHLGLVQAGEIAGIETFIADAARIVDEQVDIEALAAMFGAVDLLPGLSTPPAKRIAPPGQRIDIAADVAFEFAYPHLLDDWREAGAELRFFSPLADETPSADCDAIFLPGGYPELHAGALAGADGFKSGLSEAAARGAFVYGECGGYMVLGEGLVDAQGNRHAMSGLLKLETSFAKRKLSLGYRRLKACGGFAQKFVLGEVLNGHEFHYSVATHEEGAALFEAEDALGNALGKAGLRRDNVMGSYMHVIDQQ